MKSQTVLSFIAKGAFGLLMIVLIVLNASYGLSFISRIFPTNVVIQWASLIIFDGGALVWFMVFLFLAEGTAQRGTALSGAVLDLIGAGAIAFAEVFTSGSSFVALDPEMVSGLQVVVTYAIPLWTISNVVLTYIFHVSSPAMTQQMKAREAQDKILEQSFYMLNRKMGTISQGLADRMSEDMVQNILAEMNIPNLPARRSRAALPESPMTSLPEGGSRPFVQTRADLDRQYPDGLSLEDQEGMTDGPVIIKKKLPEKQNGRHQS